VLVALEKARTRDEVIDQLIVGMSTVARRVGLLPSRSVDSVHRLHLHLGEPKAFREIEIRSMLRRCSASPPRRGRI